jgi:hypothetical protein
MHPRFVENNKQGVLIQIAKGTTAMLQHIDHGARKANRANNFDIRKVHALWYINPNPVVYMKLTSILTTDWPEVTTKMWQFPVGIVKAS